MTTGHYTPQEHKTLDQIRRVIAEYFWPGLYDYDFIGLGAGLSSYYAVQARDRAADANADRSGETKLRRQAELRSYAAEMSHHEQKARPFIGRAFCGV